MHGFNLPCSSLCVSYIMLLSLGLSLYAFSCSKLFFSLQGITHQLSKVWCRWLFSLSVIVFYVFSIFFLVANGKKHHGTVIFLRKAPPSQTVLRGTLPSHIKSSISFFLFVLGLSACSGIQFTNAQADEHKVSCVFHLAV